MTKAPGADALRAALAHVVWVGGATDSGKTSVARALATAHDWEAYHYDRFDRVEAPGHVSRIDPARHPHMDAFRNKTLEDRWVNTTPEEMLAAWLESTAERFEFVLDDLLALPSGRLTVAEGYGMLPELVAPLLSSPRQGIWLVSDERFKRESHARRTALGEKGSLWSQLSDPQRARENHIGRDLLIAAHIRQRASERGLTVVEVDGAQTLDEVIAEVEAHVAPYLVATLRRRFSSSEAPEAPPESAARMAGHGVFRAAADGKGARRD